MRGLQQSRADSPVRSRGQQGSGSDQAYEGPGNGIKRDMLGDSTRVEFDDSVADVAIELEVAGELGGGVLAGQGKAQEVFELAKLGELFGEILCVDIRAHRGMVRRGEWKGECRLWGTVRKREWLCRT